MGRFFERILIQDRGLASYSKLRACLVKAAAAVGYVPSIKDHGVSVHLSQTEGSEWFEIESPLLEPVSDTAEAFLAALAEQSEIPILSLQCVDSDFVVCRLLDKKNGTDTIGCLNEPYEPIGEPDYHAWEKACKKKWKCKADQFRAVFEDRFVFAEDGLERLAEHMHFSPAVERDPDTEMEIDTAWFIAEEERNDENRPRTRMEALSEGMEALYAEELTRRGYRRFKNFSTRWHKVVGEPGNEVLLSIVIALWHGFDPSIFYGAQSLYCPVVFSDKYYPLHDEPDYWKDARFTYVWKFGREKDPLRIPGDPVTGRWEEVLNLTPERFRPFLEDLIFPEHESITDFDSSHILFLESDQANKLLSDVIDRFWLESIIAHDADTARETFLQKKELFERRSEQDWFQKEKQADEKMLLAYETGGIDSCMEILTKIYQRNMKKLQEAGIL